MAPPSDRAKQSSLRLRVASALVMAPVALVAVWLGGWWFAVLVVLAAFGMAWEWARLCGRGAFGTTAGAVVIAGVLPTAALASGGSVALALTLAAAGAAAVFGLAAVERQAEPLWAASGTLWLALGASSFLWLARDPARGRETALWLLALVWATDIAAYAFGRGIGGPKLAPRLSPNKTWAGFLGGVGAAALVGFAAAALTGGRPIVLVPVSLALAVAAQLGDLAESLAKRHFGVKDSSGLIPGHGGLLDRLDSLLAVAVLVGLATLARGSIPIAWR